MRKLRFALILPLIQLAIAWNLLVWKGQYITFLGNARAFCFAINAPIMVMLAPFYYLAPLRWMPSDIMGIRSDNFLALVAVGILWLLVGLRIDRFRREIRPRLDVSPFRNMLLNVFFMVCGTWLFVRVGMEWILRADSGGRHMPSDILHGAIAIAWSVFLIVPAVRSLLRAIRPETTNPAAA